MLKNLIQKEGPGILALISGFDLEVIFLVQIVK